MIFNIFHLVQHHLVHFWRWTKCKNCTLPALCRYTNYHRFGEYTLLTTQISPSLIHSNVYIYIYMCRHRPHTKFNSIFFIKWVSKTKNRTLYNQLIWKTTVTKYWCTTIKTNFPSVFLSSSSSSLLLSSFLTFVIARGAFILTTSRIDVDRHIDVN